MTERPNRPDHLRWVDRLLPDRILAEEADERLRQRLLVACGLLAFVIVAPWYAVMFALDPAPRIPRMIALALFASFAANALWLRWLATSVVAWIMVVLVHLAVLAVVTLAGGLGGPAALVVPCLPVFAGVFLGSRAGWASGGLVVLAAGAIEMWTYLHGVPNVTPPEIWPFVRVTSLVIGASLMLLAVTAHLELSRRQTSRLGRARDDALSASRAKSEFLSAVSHELRTPMVGVVGAIDLLNRSDLDPRQRELLEVLQTSAGAQLELIGDVLDLSRIEAGEIDLELRSISPRELLDGVATLFRTACEAKSLALTVEVDASVPEWIRADGPRLRQVVSNLVANALKFTVEGSITIRAATRGHDPLPRLEVAVADTGIGIDPEHSQQIFEAFRQADQSTTRRHGGSGLGLSICRRLVEAMGGTISLESALGRGSTFRFEIPAPFAEPPADDGDQSDETARRPLRVLLADDDPVNRLVLSAMLKRLGHAPIVAENGWQAVELAAGQPIDLIFLDMRMPELDGEACARAIRSLDGPAGSVPMLCLTADAVADKRSQYLASGFDAVYSKPINLKQLDRAIASAVSRPSTIPSS